MDANNRRREFLQSRVDDFPHNRHGVIDCAVGGIANFDDSVVAVEINNFKDFGLEVTHLRHDHVNNILAEAIFCFGKDFNITETPPDFEAA